MGSGRPGGKTLTLTEAGLLGLLHKVHAWRRVQSSSVWFWGKEHSLQTAPKQKCTQRVTHPFLLLLVILYFFFIFWGKEYSLKLASGTNICIKHCYFFLSSFYPFFLCSYLCSQELAKKWRNRIFPLLFIVLSFLGLDFPKGILAAGIWSSQQKQKTTVMWV